MMSLYNVGALHDRNTRFSANGLDFPQGADWTIGVFNEDVAERLIAGLLLKPFEFYGMKLLNVKRQEPPTFETSKNYYWASAPILTRWSAQEGLSREHLVFDDPRSTITLTQTLKHKAEEAGLGDYWQEDTHVAFDQAYPKAKTKLITVKNVENRANLCPVIVQAHEKIQYLSWVVGVGESTGIGFGSLNYARSL
jgi:CRISPR-associated endoribonuclease Cas6